MIFDKHANLKYKFGNRHFWAEGYYVSTVGLNEATIKKYIQEQEKHDIALDKLSVKEYEDPFKGWREVVPLPLYGVVTSQKQYGLNGAVGSQTSHSLKWKPAPLDAGLVTGAYSPRANHPFDGWLWYKYNLYIVEKIK